MEPQDTVSVAVNSAALGKVTVEFVDGPMNSTEAEVLSEGRMEPGQATAADSDEVA